MTDHQARFRALVGRCTYKPGWTLRYQEDAGGRGYVQVHARTVCSITLKPTEWSAAKHYLSPFMCDQEVVGVCFRAIKEAEEHELREFFRYRDVAIFNPHIDPDALVEVAHRIVARKDPMHIR